MATDAFTRRSVLSGGLVVAAGAVTGYGVAAASSVGDDTDSQSGANEYGAGSTEAGQELALVDDIPADGVLVLEDADVVLVRSEGDDVRAFSALCTHQGCTVQPGADAILDCPCHGSEFAADTGEVLVGPATQPLPAVDVVVRGGSVFTT